jgi:hypothetical protein
MDWRSAVPAPRLKLAIDHTLLCNNQLVVAMMQEWQA